MKPVKQFYIFVLTSLFIFAAISQADAQPRRGRFPICKGDGKNVIPQIIKKGKKTNILPDANLALPNFKEVLSESTLRSNVRKTIRRTASLSEALEYLENSSAGWALKKRNILIDSYLAISYKENFGIKTFHLKNLFEKITSFQDPKVNRLLAQRIDFLREQTPAILSKLELTGISEEAIRLRYFGDIDKLTPKNFDPNNLWLSVEQKMSPNPNTDFPLNNINGKTQIQIDGKMYPLYNYKGPLSNLHEMYTFLVNGNSRNPSIQVKFDEDGRTLFVSNKKKTRWIRITPHEYRDSNRLHIHVNDQQQVTLVLPHQPQRIEKVNINLIIPFNKPEELRRRPFGVSEEDFLYHKLIVEPVHAFRRMGIFVEEGSIY